MDQVLDDEIQALTSSGMDQATHAVHRIVTRSGPLVLLLLLVGSGLGGTTALVVGRSVTNPVRRLVSACERIARGDFSEPVHVGTRDEFALLASSFNAMAAERERAEAALRRRDELQLVIDTNPSRIFVKDWDGRFTLANRAVAEAYGATVPELLGKSDADFTSNRDEVERSLQDDRTVMTTGQAKLIPEEPATDRATGETRWFQTVKVPLPSVPGATRQVLVVATDISERKRAEGALARAKDAAETASRELEAFSYSVAHDLRAPLRGIDGFSQALLEDYSERLDAEGKRYLERVRESAQNMALLIESLLILARVTQSDLRREQVDLSALARTTAARVRAGQPERNVEVLIADGLTAHGDAHLLGVAFENLLDNAWKFTQDRPQARIEVGCRQENGQPVFFVRDNGAGFDMAFAAKLFGVFQRLHTPDEFKGTGIGLATVQRIVHRHGGRIWAEGKVNEGASFYFTLAEGGGRA
jgi:PAS domain S-box-containing protein